MDYFIVQLYSLILFIAYIIFFCCLCIYIICICFLHCLCCAGQKDQPVLHYPMRLPPSWSSYLLIFHTVTTVHPSAVARSCAPSSSMFDDGCLALSLVMAVASGQHWKLTDFIHAVCCLWRLCSSRQRLALIHSAAMAQEGLEQFSAAFCPIWRSVLKKYEHVGEKWNTILPSRID